MNYEEFSPEAQKVIDQFRVLIENIKSGKDKAKICYWGRVNISPMIYEVNHFHARYSNMNTIMESYCFVARIHLLEKLDHLYKTNITFFQNFLHMKI